MTPQEFAGPFLQLCLLYALKREISGEEEQELYDATWYEAVRRLRADQWQAAVAECARTRHSDQFRPTPADLLACADAVDARCERLAHDQGLRRLQAPRDERFEQPPTAAERARWEETMGQVWERLQRSSGPLRDDLAITAAQLHDTGRLAALPSVVDLGEPTVEELSAAEACKAERP